MKSNSQIIIRKIAHKHLISTPGRNAFLLLTIFMSTFMIATIISLCVNQIETQQLYINQYQGSTNNKIEPVIYVLVMIIILLVIASFLFIYNVMSVSISIEIRFYGQLRTIGMSQKQIKRMVFQQILFLCGIGIPLGLFFSALVCLVAVPKFLSMYTQVSLVEYSINFHPLIFIGAVLLILITVITGAYKPIWKAAQVSPIEALRFVEYGYVRKKTQTSAFSPIKMAWRNVFRVPKQVILVFCSLFLGMTMFLAVSVILNSLNVDMFVETAGSNIRGDIYLRNGITQSYKFTMGNTMDVFTPGFMNSLNELPGLVEKRVSYVHGIRMNITDIDGETVNLQGCVYGIDENYIAKLNKELEVPIDEMAFLQGEFVIIRNILKYPSFEMDSVTFSLENMETMVSFEVGGVLPSEFSDYYGIAYNRLPSVYMSTKLLKQIIEKPEVYDIELNIEKNQQKQTLSRVKELTANNEDIILCSEIAIRQEAENIVSTLTIMGNGISAILWLIGILNFINVITAGILSRRHEFALLESVGQSVKQSKKILLYEGLIYAIISLLLVMVFGNVITYGFFSAMAQQFEYIVFDFPFISFFLMLLAVFAICLTIPKLIYRFVSRASIVERLKEIE